jgi:hypothetical protein
MRSSSGLCRDTILENLTVTGETFPFHQYTKASEQFCVLLTEVPIIEMIASIG